MNLKLFRAMVKFFLLCLFLLPALGLKADELLTPSDIVFKMKFDNLKAYIKFEKQRAKFDKEIPYNMYNFIAGFKNYSTKREKEISIFFLKEVDTFLQFLILGDNSSYTTSLTSLFVIITGEKNFNLFRKF